MTRKIFTINSKLDEEFLRKPTQEVKDIKDAQILNLIKEMQEIMKQYHGIGLAANQIGENKRIIVIQVENQSFVLINPEIIKYSTKKIDGEEGCLSVPGISGIVERHQSITIKGINELNKKIKIKAKNIVARVFQHEFDHLNGVLFIDKASKLFKIGNRNID
jgi:peptide deformylase